MTVDVEAREDLILQRLRDRYEREGYSFHAHPPRELLPAFLGAYRPDALALKGNGGVVVEIKLPPPRGGARLSEIARLFKDQTEWRLEIISLDEVADVLEIGTFSRSLIEDQLDGVQQLAREGRNRAAFAIGWATLEAATRALLSEANESNVTPRSPMQIGEILARYGFLDQATARTLSALVQARNSVVHGNLSYEIDPNTVTTLIDITRSLVSQLHDAPRLSPRS
jgi:uncharacterized protein YutE (UPF0331/DUF86 family)